MVANSARILGDTGHDLVADAPAALVVEVHLHLRVVSVWDFRFRGLPKPKTLNPVPTQQGLTSKRGLLV